MLVPDPRYQSPDDRDERDVGSGDEGTDESFAGKDLDELQDEFDDEEARPSER